MVYVYENFTMNLSTPKHDTVKISAFIYIYNPSIVFIHLITCIIIPTRFCSEHMLKLCLQGSYPSSIIVCDFQGLK